MLKCKTFNIIPILLAKIEIRYKQSRENKIKNEVWKENVFPNAELINFEVITGTESIIK